MVVDEMTDYGLHRMDPGDVHQTLASETVGVLGLPDGPAPCLRPMSYWFDGDDTLYFVYVDDGDSRKVALSDRADRATFLVYRVDAPFNWQSILLTGTLERVPADERGAIEERLDVAWRPEVLERESDAASTALYALEIETREGVKQLQRPFETAAE